MELILGCKLWTQLLSTRSDVTGSMMQERCYDATMISFCCVKGDVWSASSTALRQKKQNKFKTKRKQKADNAHFDSVGDRHITPCTCNLGAAVVLGDCTRILHDLTSSLGSMTVHRSEGSLVRKLGTERKYFMTGTPFVLFQKQWRLQKAGNLWQRNFLIFSKHLRACLACFCVQYQLYIKSVDR